MIANVVDFQPVETGAVTELSSVQVYQRAIRVWSGHLDPFELALVLQIIDRTLGWKKTRIAISTTRFLQGDKAYSGLKMGRTKMFEALSSLETKGIIARHPHPEGKEIKVYSVNIGWSPDMLNIPKRLQNQSASRTTQSAQRTTPVRVPDTRERILGEGDIEKEDYTVEPAAPLQSDPQEVIRKAVTFHRAALTAKKVKNGDVVSGAEAAWRLAFAETFPVDPAAAWTLRDKGMVKGKAKNWLHAAEMPFVDFLDWSVRNWAAVVTKQLGWMKKSPPPKLPSIGFFISFMDQFADCWGEGKLDDWLKSSERTEMEKLELQGLSREEAAAKIGRDRAVQTMRQENEEIRVEARGRVRRAQMIEKRAMASADMPAHPRSRAATKAVKAEEIIKPQSSDVDWSNIQPLDPNWEPPL